VHLSLFHCQRRSPHKKLLAYQFAFDLLDGGAQDFSENVGTELPEGDKVCVRLVMENHSIDAAPL
jgi:hypothetical protein